MEDTCEVKVLADQAADKNNFGNHLAHNFVGISQRFTTSISHGSERVVEHHTGDKKAKYLKIAKQLKATVNSRKHIDKRKLHVNAQLHKRFVIFLSRSPQLPSVGEVT